MVIMMMMMFIYLNVIRVCLSQKPPVLYLSEIYEIFTFSVRLSILRLKSTKSTSNFEFLQCKNSIEDLTWKEIQS